MFKLYHRVVSRVHCPLYHIVPTLLHVARLNLLFFSLASCLGEQGADLFFFALRARLQGLC